MNDMAENDNVIDSIQLRIRLCCERHDNTLDLSDLGLKQVPEEIKKIRHLKGLNLSENTLSEIPAFIGELSLLEYLDLSYNKLTELPEEIGNLTAIETLSLRCNEIKAIPESIGNIIMLNRLDLSYNHLSSLPKSINKLIHLKHCNIRGNYLSAIPDKITELLEPKNYNLFGHIEHIVELTGKNGLSNNIIASAKSHIEYVSQKLKITTIQTVLFSHIVAKFDDDPVKMNEIAESLNCNRLKVMQYMGDFEELEKRKLIRSRKQQQRNWGLTDGTPIFYIPKEVLYSLLKNQEYQPIDQSNLSIEELFIRIEILFTQRIGDDAIDYEELKTLMFDLLNENNHLPFVKKIKEYELTSDSLMILLRFCHSLINMDTTEMALQEIPKIFNHHSTFALYRRQFKNGEHMLITQGFIENTFSEGFSNRETFKLTDRFKKELLSEVKIKKSLNNKGITRSEKIQEKILFYNEKEKEQINRLASILEARAFNEVQKRLSDSGMRTGFACLFTGPPGVGKSETVYQIARQTGRDILMVDISQSKSMWFGESEKIIKKIFSSYQEYVEESEITPILLFNEADAIFGKRKDVSSSAVAQTENAIQNIILQEMENLKGILIATTNLVDNLDKAFERRFLFKIEFKKPELTIRQSIWKSIIPTLSDEDARKLASFFDFTGGQIENISRKSTVEFVLSGIEPSLEKLMYFCQEELIHNANAIKIGFTA